MSDDFKNNRDEPQTKKALMAALLAEQARKKTRIARTARARQTGGRDRLNPTGEEKARTLAEARVKKQLEGQPGPMISDAGRYGVQQEAGPAKEASPGGPEGAPDVPAGGQSVAAIPSPITQVTDTRANQSGVNRVKPDGEKVSPRMAEQGATEKRKAAPGAGTASSAGQATGGAGKAVAAAMGVTGSGLGFFKFIDFLTG